MSVMIVQVCDTTHHTTLAVQVRVNLLLERRLIQVTGSYGDANGDGLFLGFPSDILEDGDTGVNSTALLEESADRSSRALGGDEDNVDISGGNDFCVLLVDNGETVAEVKCFALGNQRRDGRPGLGLCSVREQIHNNCASVNSLLNGE